MNIYVKFIIMATILLSIVRNNNVNGQSNATNSSTIASTVSTVTSLAGATTSTSGSSAQSEYCNISSIF